MHTSVQHTFDPAGTARPLSRPLPGRVAVPLIGLASTGLWIGLFALWRAIG